MKEKESSNSYKSILKGTTIFGGVQIFNILITLVRGKFVAVILGPEGMGISSLFNAASNTIQRFSSLGLNQAIVRETALSSDQSDKSEKVISTTKKLIRLTALLGLIICVAFCVPLSRLTFGDSSMAWQFILLGAVVGLAVESSGKLAILQGLHQVKRISKVSVVSGLTGLLIGVPLYYIFGDKGIVPAMAAVSLALYIFSTLSLHRCYRPTDNRFSFSWKENLPLIKRLILLGIVLMASDLIGSLVTYLINLFLRIIGSIDDVGLYQAANSITNQYAGLVFAAMAMDYYPRLAKVSEDNTQVKKIVNRQTEVVALLIAPAMCLLILSAPLIIRVLLSEKFLSVIPLMRWMGLGILFRALSFPMGYITFAKGNKKVFFYLEGLTGNLMLLVFSCLGFWLFGIIGLGYALVAEAVLSLLIYFIVNNRLYSYNFSKDSLGYLFYAALFGIATFIASDFQSPALSYSLMGVLTAFTIFYGIRTLRSKLSQSSDSVEDDITSTSPED